MSTPTLLAPDDLVIGRTYKFRYAASGKDWIEVGKLVSITMEYGIMWWNFDTGHGSPVGFDHACLAAAEIVKMEDE